VTLPGCHSTLERLQDSLGRLGDGLETVPDRAEGTSQLDMAREQVINSEVAAMGITRIVIAHRAETIAMADRIYVLEGGALAERPGTPIPAGVV
jgi:hypothetical protein